MKLIFTIGTLIYFLIYLILVVLIDNYFLTAKYGLIKNILLKRKFNLRTIIKFANKHYLTTLGIHVLSFLIIFIPLTLLATILFILLPLNPILAVAIFIPLLFTYLIFITVRLLFVYPTMTFKKTGAYNSLKEDFHFVKTHGHHALITWLIIIGINIFVSIFKDVIHDFSTIFTQQIYFFTILFVVILLSIEILVSVWEHVFIFKSYLVGKKK